MGANKKHGGVEFIILFSVCVYIMLNMCVNSLNELIKNIYSISEYVPKPHR